MAIDGTENNFASDWGEDAGDGFEQGGLARAVGTDKAEAFPVINSKIYVFEQDFARVDLADALAVPNQCHPQPFQLRAVSAGFASLESSESGTATVLARRLRSEFEVRAGNEKTNASKKVRDFMNCPQLW